MEVWEQVICNRKDNERIVGMHYLGWNGGEVIQGTALARLCNPALAISQAPVKRQGLTRCLAVGGLGAGYGMALKLKATKVDLDNLVGIHPTNAEIFTTLNITKRSGEDWQAVSSALLYARSRGSGSCCC